MKVSTLTLALTAIVVYIAITQLNWPALANAFLSANPYWIGVSAASWVILIALKAFKWQSIVSALRGKISLRDSIRTLFIGFFVSIATPSRLGDFVRAAYLKNQMGLGRGTLAVLMDRAMDVLTLILFAGAGITLLSQSQGVTFLSTEFILILLGAGIAGLFALLNRSIAQKMFHAYGRFLPLKWHAFVRKNGKEFYDAIPDLRKKWKNVFVAALLSVPVWLISVTFGWFLFQSLNLPLTWYTALAIIPILALMEIIPLGILGVGTREIVTVFMLGLLSVPAETAVVFSLLYFALGYIPGFIIGAYFFNRKPIPIQGDLKILFSGFGKKKK